MITFAQKQIYSSTKIEILPTVIVSHPQCNPQPTLYDYLAVMAALITAITPLILSFSSIQIKRHNQDES